MKVVKFIQVAKPIQLAIPYCEGIANCFSANDRNFIDEALEANKVVFIRLNNFVVTKMKRYARKQLPSENWSQYLIPISAVLQDIDVVYVGSVWAFIGEEEAVEKAVEKVIMCKTGEYIMHINGFTRRGYV